MKQTVHSPAESGRRTSSGAGSGPLRMAITEPTAIDPYRVQEMEGMSVTKALYEGLLVLDAGGQVVGGTAARWASTDDGRRWTFRLRPDSLFSTGEPVTAHSFVRAWNRATDPRAGSETAYHLSGIAGFRERLSGESGQLAGVTAADDLVLEVHLGEPDHEFHLKTLQPTFFPVSTAAGHATNAAHNARPIGNGPFAMAGPWQRGKAIRLTRNPTYAGRRMPHLDGVDLRILPPQRALTDEFEAFTRGELDLTRIPPGAQERAGELLAQGCRAVRTEVAGVMYLLPFTHHGVLADARARKAVSHAIDREAVIRQVLCGDQVLGCGARPASSLIPPAIAGHVAHPGRIRHDPALARSLAHQAGLAPGTVLDLATNVGAGHEEWVTAVARQLEDTLGLRVRVSDMTAAELVAYRTSERATGCCRAGWMCDYPTPDNVLFPLLHSSCVNPDASGTAHGDNEGRYQDQEFDELIRRARATPGEQQRIALYQAAEQQAIGEHMAIIPLWYLAGSRLLRPYLRGVRLDAFGCVVFEEIEVSPVRE